MCAKGIRSLLVSHSLVWVRETNLQVEDASVCVCVCVQENTVLFRVAVVRVEDASVCVCVCVCKGNPPPFYVKKLSNIGPGAGLGPTKVVGMFFFVAQSFELKTLPCVCECVCVGAR